jgi:hypothetical protein
MLKKHPENIPFLSPVSVSEGDGVQLVVADYIGKIF